MARNWQILGSGRFGKTTLVGEWIATMPTLNVQTRPSQANQISILLAKEYNQIILSIEDDGIGFDPSVFAREDTTGLRNMAERAKMLGGSLEVQSKVRQGTHLTMRVPVSPITKCLTS